MSARKQSKRAKFAHWHVCENHRSRVRRLDSPPGMTIYDLCLGGRRTGFSAVISGSALTQRSKGGVPT